MLMYEWTSKDRKKEKWPKAQPKMVNPGCNGFPCNVMQTNQGSTRLKYIKIKTHVQIEWEAVDLNADTRWSFLLGRLRYDYYDYVICGKKDEQFVVIFLHHLTKVASCFKQQPSKAAGFFSQMVQK